MPLQLVEKRSNLPSAQAMRSLALLKENGLVIYLCAIFSAIWTILPDSQAIRQAFQQPLDIF